jgi:hypothetical protein
MLTTWKKNLANILFWGGRFQEARQLYEEAMMASISTKHQRSIYDLASGVKDKQGPIKDQKLLLLG